MTATAVLRPETAGFEPINLTAGGSIVIGRSRSADYRVEHPQVSGLQCTVSLSSTGVLSLEDTSTNGTFVDGRLIGRGVAVDLSHRSCITLLVASIEERNEEFDDGVIPAFYVELRSTPLAPSTSPVGASKRTVRAGAAAPSSAPRAWAKPPRASAKRVAADSWQTGSCRRPLRRSRLGPSVPCLLPELSSELVALIVAFLDSSSTLHLGTSCKRLAVSCQQAVETLHLKRLATPLPPPHLSLLLGRFRAITHLTLAPNTLAHPPLPHESCAVLTTRTARRHWLKGVDAADAADAANAADAAADAADADSESPIPAESLTSGHVLASLLPNLTTLHVAGNTLLASGAQHLADALRAAAISIDINTTSTTLRDATTSPTSPPRRRALPLASLDLSNTRLGVEWAPTGTSYPPDAPTSLLRSLGRAHSLTSLGLSSNHLGTWAASPLAHWLASPSCALASLDLSRNALSDLGTEMIARSLRSNTSLTSLDLAENLVTDSGCRKLAKCLDLVEHFGHNATLRSLGLAWNGIEYAAAIDLVKKVTARVRRRDIVGSLGSIASSDDDDAGVPSGPFALARIDLGMNAFGIYHGHEGGVGAPVDGMGMTSAQLGSMRTAVRKAREAGLDIVCEVS